MMSKLDLIHAEARPIPSRQADRETRGLSTTIVVAGYGAWAMTDMNPAAHAAREVARRRWVNARVIALEVSVDTDALHHTVDAALAEYEPDAWLGVGLAPSSTMIRAEMVGINWRHFDVADNRGVLKNCEPVTVDGPVAFDATAPNAEIVAAIRAAGIPAVLSFSAGTHLCNQMLYTTRYLADKRNLDVRCGFLHVPYASQQIARLAPGETQRASLPLETIVEATALAVEQLVRAVGKV